MEENRSISKILIVDDVPKNIQVLGSILLKERYNISFASNGEDAVRLAGENEVDLILLDVMMPGIDGFETCRRLKAGENTSEIPVIFMTALSETTDKVKGFECGAVDYVTKPYEAEEVLARVKTHLTIRHLRKDLEERINELEVRNHFIRRTFGRYLSDDVVANLLESPDGLQVGGENLNVTILMADIRGFSSVTEKLSPEQVVTMLNIYLSIMTDVIIKYEGTIDEFIGDGILVIFGAPIWQEDHAARAVACALEMQLSMDKLNADFAENGFPAVQIGIGINTGEVVVGNIGSQKRAKYGVVGRNVNIASRIESYTVGGQILISENTYESVKGDVDIVKEVRVNPKGVTAPIKLFDVKGISSPFNVHYEQKEENLHDVERTIPCRYVVLDEKSADHIAMNGKLHKISDFKAVIELEEETGIFSNLKISIDEKNCVEEPCVLYAKVLDDFGKTNSYIIHFTHIPEKAKILFKKLRK